MASYTVVVTKLPQEASLEVATQITAYANEKRRTVAYSLDDVLRLMDNPDANERSFVEVVNPHEPSQVDTIDELEALGIEWVAITMDKSLLLPVNYSQRDPSWKNYPTGGGHTIGSWGCLHTVYCNMANFLKLCTDNPQKFVDRMTASGCNVNGAVQPAALRTMFPTKVNYVGWYTTDVFNHIKKSIDRGIPVPCRVDLDPSAGYTQHWVLAIGYTPTGQAILADPWPYPATQQYQDKTAYRVIYEVIIYNLDVIPPIQPPPTTKYNLQPFFNTSERASTTFELATKIDGTVRWQERIQLQKGTNDITVRYICKNGLFEQIKLTGTHIQRGIDTSPDELNWYALTQGTNILFVNWLRNEMAIGETYVSMPVVTSYSKTKSTPTGCEVTSPSQSTNDYLTLDAIYPTFAGYNGVVLGKTIKVSWRKTSNVNTIPIEVYYFTEGMGLTGWGETSSGKQARVSEVHKVGDRPDNTKIWYCIPQEWRL